MRRNRAAAPDRGPMTAIRDDAMPAHIGPIATVYFQLQLRTKGRGVVAWQHIGVTLHPSAIDQKGESRYEEGQETDTRRQA